MRTLALALLLLAVALLPWLTTAARGVSAAEQCSQRFVDFADVVVWVSCPPACLRRLLAAQPNTSTQDTASPQPSQAAVYGRYAYDALPSICLSAIHSGAIDDEAKGGAVRMCRFPAVDWSNSSMQTIFPYDSWRVAVVYGLHRFPHDSTGSGVLTIGSYFLQLSLIFLASQWMPPMLGVVNLSLLASHRPYGAQVGGEGGGDVSPLLASCVLPLDDYQHLALQLASPALVAAALAALAAVQWAVRRLLPLSSSHIARWLYRRTFDFDEQAEQWSGEGEAVASDGQSLNSAAGAAAACAAEWGG